MFKIKTLFTFLIMAFFVMACNKNDQVKEQIKKTMNAYEGESEKLKALSDELMTLDASTHFSDNFPANSKINWEQMKLLFSTSDKLYKQLLPIVSPNGQVNAVLYASTNKYDKIQEAKIVASERDEHNDSLFTKSLFKAFGKRDSIISKPVITRQTGAKIATAEATCTLYYYADVVVDYYVDANCHSRSEMIVSLNDYLTKYVQQWLDVSIPNVQATIAFNTGHPITITQPTSLNADEVANTVRFYLEMGMQDLVTSGNTMPRGCTLNSGYLVGFLSTGTGCPAEALIKEEVNIPVWEATDPAIDKTNDGVMVPVNLICHATVNKYQSSGDIKDVSMGPIIPTTPSTEYVDSYNRYVKRTISISGQNYSYSLNTPTNATLVWSYIINVQYIYPNGETPTNTRSWLVTHTIDY